MERNRDNVVGHVSVSGTVVEFQDTACDNCGGRDADILFTGTDRFLFLPGEFRLVQCFTCGLIRQNPMPSAAGMSAYYPPDYEPYSTSIDREPVFWRRWDRRYGMMKRRRLVEGMIPSGRLLDVGCATGNFLAEMQRTGRWEVVGVEPSAHAANYAVKEQGLDVRIGTCREIDFPDASFDVITLWNVLEHLNTPITDLQRLERWLKPGGCLVFSLPNLESYEVRLFGRRWFGWELPRHLYFFPRETLARLTRDLDLTIETSTCLSGTHLGFTLSFRHFFAEWPVPPRWHHLLSIYLDSLPCRLTLLPVFYLLGRFGQGMIVTYTARKGSTVARLRS